MLSLDFWALWRAWASFMLARVHFFLSVCCRWGYKKIPAILKKTFRHVVRAVALRKAFLSGFTTIPRDAAVASRQAAQSHFFCSHSWRIFGTFSMFSYIKEKTVTQTFINVFRKFWSQKESSDSRISKTSEEQTHVCTDMMRRTEEPRD